MPNKRLTKAEVLSAIANATQLDRKSVAAVLDGLRDVASLELRRSGEFVVPGILKLRSVDKPATVDRPGVNPFTKLPITIKGKPASRKVRASPLKSFRETVQAPAST